MPFKSSSLPAAADLLEWYDRHARSLPWRISPQDRRLGIVPDPYRIWLSEIMLQQTTVATVKAYFEKFTALWPTLADLAAADREEILQQWAGLGYYSRARNLKKCADVLATDYDGKFPDTETELLSLPGIGPYTAAAIAAIAFDEPAVVVDGNIERVISRLFEIEEELPKAKIPIKAGMAKLTPQERAGDFAQAMMDLGATICTPKNPACGLCPWREPCGARIAGNQEIYPRKAPKKKKPTRFGFAFVAARADGSVLLRKRPENGLLAGMTEVIGSDWQDGAFPELDFPIQSKWQECAEITRHTFTHFHLEVRVFKATFTTQTPAFASGYWCPNIDLNRQALPTIMKKILENAHPNSLKPKK